MARFLADLRVRLIGLVLLAVIPALGLLLYTDLEDRRLDTLAAQAESLRAARFASGELTELINNGRQFLTAAADLPQIDSDDLAIGRPAAREACATRLAALMKQDAVYANFTVASTTGDLLCSALPSSEPINVTNLDAFHNILDQRTFVFSTYITGPVTRKPSLGLGVPIVDDTDQETHGVLFAFVSLDWLAKLEDRAQLPAGATIDLVDREGRLLAGYPAAPAQVNEPVPEAPAIRTFLAQSREGALEGSGPDGQPRLFAVAPLGPLSDGGAAATFVSVGMPPKFAVTESGLGMTQNLIGLGLVTMLALSVAYGLGKPLVLRSPLEQIAHLSTKAGASESRFQTLFEKNLSAMVVVDPDEGYIVDANPAFLKMTGFSAADLRLRRIWEMSPTEEQEPTRLEWKQQSRRGGATLTGTLQIRTADGRGITSHYAAWARQLGGRELQVFAMRDVTEQRRTEDELRRVNRALQLLSACHQAVIHAADEGTLLSIVCKHIADIGEYSASIGFAEHDEARTLLPVAGCDCGHLEGEQWTWSNTQSGHHPVGAAVRTGQTLVCNDIAASFWDSRWRDEMLRQGFASAIALPLIAEGVTLGAIAITAPQRDTFHPEEVRLLEQMAGDIAFGITTLRHRAEHEQAVAALGESEQKYRQLFDAMPIGIVISDSDRHLVKANTIALTLGGYTTADLDGIDLASLYEDDAQRAEFIRTLQKTGRVRDQMVAFKRINAPPITVLVNSDRIQWDNRSLLLTTLRDVTDLKRAEADKKRVQDQLFHSQKMEAIGTLAGGVAHDFNNLLTAIQGYAGLARAAVDPADPLRRDLEEIQRTASRAASLTRRLLLFSQKQPMEFVPLALNHTVDGMLKMLSRLIGEDIAIETDLAPDLGAICGDAGQLEQVVMNLAVNARDAMPTGGKLTIKTENTLYPEDPGGSSDARRDRFVVMSVTDTGTGMNRETLQHIFEPFFTTKASGKGTGPGAFGRLWHCSSTQGLGGRCQ